MILKISMDCSRSLHNIIFMNGKGIHLFIISRVCRILRGFTWIIITQREVDIDRKNMRIH